VKAYVKRNKNDAADAEAICEAVVRPTMRFVAAKTAEQQAALLLHRGREIRRGRGLDGSSSERRRAVLSWPGWNHFM
jgi:hypothetical protein